MIDPTTYRTETPRYTGVAIALHWIIAIAIIANIGFAMLTEDLSRAERVMYMGWHKALGITILVLSVSRLVWRLMNRPPRAPATSPDWQNAAAGALHWLFYILMIGIPLGGWIMVSAAETFRPFTWFGLFPVPALPIGPNEELSETVSGWHELLGTAMIPLMLLHIGAALKHQFWDKDNLLARMRP